jgi:hypothetical protein
LAATEVLQSFPSFLRTYFNLEYKETKIDIS